MTDRPDLDLVASNIAASVMARRHDFMSWPTEHGIVWPILQALNLFGVHWS
ncbi:hypothetical protein V1281_001896 [Nitrobacteraceae bacterium AZCC 2161]